MTGRHGYPRPQLRRNDWLSLNGTWDFALDPDVVAGGPEDIIWSSAITVPFSPETVASGIGDRSFFSACWYRRLVDLDRVAPGERLILHFGAVDHEATVWVNGAVAARHTGGYTPFSVDITPLVDDGAVQQEIVVRAFDDPHDLAKPRGKQDWQEAPHGIWYPRTSGIWQTVWIERLGESAIQQLRWTSNLERWEIALDARIDGPRRDDLRLRVRLRFVDNVLVDDTYSVVSGEVHRRLALSDPGIDDYRNELLWSPSCPTLIQADLQLLDTAGNVLDTAESYTAMRQVGVAGGHFMLNGRPYPLRMVLDQGYWPQSGLTAPDDDALRNDVLLTKAMGFNGARKHQKIEDPRYLYWADLEGLLVWEEMPSAYRFTKEAVTKLTTEWQSRSTSRGAYRTCRRWRRTAITSRRCITSPARWTRIARSSATMGGSRRRRTSSGSTTTTKITPCCASGTRQSTIFRSSSVRCGQAAGRWLSTDTSTPDSPSW
jgi:hypothetical protein